MANSVPWLGTTQPLVDSYGSIENRLVTNTTLSDSRVFQLTWTPSPAIAAHLPPGFTWDLRCVTSDGTDSLRVVPSSSGWAGFTAKAFMIGSTAGSGLVDGASWFLFRRLRHTHDWLKNRLTDVRAVLLLPRQVSESDWMKL